MFAGGLLAKKLGDDYVSSSKLRPKVGDIIEVMHTTYYHFAVYIGDGYTLGAGDVRKNGSKTCTIVKKTLEKLNSDDFGMQVNNLSYYADKLKLTAYSPEDIVERAMSCYNDTRSYDLFKNNCEHFATWCRYGEAFSVQTGKGDPVVVVAKNVGKAVGQAVAVPVVDALTPVVKAAAWTGRMIDNGIKKQEEDLRENFWLHRDDDGCVIL